jgi:hypothetical protein
LPPGCLDDPALALLLPTLSSGITITLSGSFENSTTLSPSSFSRIHSVKLLPSERLPA